MELTFECPACHAVCRRSDLEAASEAVCSRCQSARALRRDAIDASTLRACSWCGTEDLYVQKDFPQGLGLAIVVVGFVISTVFWYQDRPVPALGVLLLSALVDMALFYLVPDVTICYRCLSQYRGPGTNPAGRYKAFDLAIGERYRQERLRVEELRARAGSHDDPLIPAPEGGPSEA
jgi:hypothetical protein